MFLNSCFFSKKETLNNLASLYFSHYRQLHLMFCFDLKSWMLVTLQSQDGNRQHRELRTLILALTVITSIEQSRLPLHFAWHCLSSGSCDAAVVLKDQYPFSSNYIPIIITECNFAKHSHSLSSDTFLLSPEQYIREVGLVRSVLRISSTIEGLANVYVWLKKSNRQEWTI